MRRSIATSLGVKKIKETDLQCGGRRGWREDYCSREMSISVFLRQISTDNKRLGGAAIPDEHHMAASACQNVDEVLHPHRLHCRHQSRRDWHFRSWTTKLWNQSVPVYPAASWLSCPAEHTDKQRNTMKLVMITWFHVLSYLRIRYKMYNNNNTNKKYVLSNSGVCPMQLFYFWSRDIHPVQNLLLCTKFHRNQMIFRWDMAIYRFSKWRPSAILELFTTIRDYPRSLCYWPQLPVKFHVNLIRRSEDIAIWIFRIFGLKCLFRPPKWGFWETLDP